MIEVAKSWLLEYQSPGQLVISSEDLMEEEKIVRAFERGAYLAFMVRVKI